MTTELRRACAALAIAFFATAAISARAQIPQSPPARPDQAPQARPTTPAPPSPRRNDDSLSQSPGVIRPPPVGDGGVMTPPNTDKTPMPVIPPPGPPGGNPNVKPQ